MKMLKNKKFLAIAGIILALASFAVFATNSNIVWNPARFAPASIAPGQSMNAAVSFTNRGLSNINGKELSLEIRGDAAGIVSASSPTFPENIKKGDTVSVNLSVHAPSDQAVRVVNGTLVLLKMKSDGKTKEVFGDVLPLEITLSPFPLPPNPGEAGKATIEGVDIGGGPNGEPNGVRDDIDRYIGFTFPNSEKARMGLTQYAKEDQKFIEDFLATANDPVEQKRVTRGNDVERSKASECSLYTLGVIDRPKYDFNPDGTIVGDLGRKDEEMFRKAIIERKKLKSQFLNTTERQVAFGNADALLGGTGGGDMGDDRTLCQGFGFDPDLLPN